MRTFFAVAIACGVVSYPASAVAGPSKPFSHVFLTPPISVAPSESAGIAPEGSAPVALPDFELQDPPAGQQTAKPPQREHTGFGALIYTTAADFKAFPRRKSTWVILGIGLGAAAIAHTADDDLQEHFADSEGAGVFGPGKYIGSFYVQLGTATGLYLVGRYVVPPAAGEGKTNKISHLGFDLVRALIVSQALTQGIKYATQRDRPSGDCCSFPSGHASATFATASVLERHLGYRGAWPTFVIASYVAASRLRDNRHFLSDVVFGSAVGIASGWTVVGRHGRSEFAMVPAPTRGGVMITFQSRPRTDRGVAARQP
jgi:membrane-associated phospholipid phosphatase